MHQGRRLRYHLATPGIGAVAYALEAAVVYGLVAAIAYALEAAVVYGLVAAVAYALEAAIAYGLVAAVAYALEAAVAYAVVAVTDDTVVAAAVAILSGSGRLVELARLEGGCGGIYEGLGLILHPLLVVGLQEGLVRRYLKGKLTYVT